MIGLAGIIASVYWNGAWRIRSRDDRAILVVFAIGIIFTLIAFVVGPIMQLALSRRRESLADVSGVELTRNPTGLINALKKLEGNDKPFAKFNHATAAMCIDDPLQHHESWFHHLFDTHPPLEDRIKRLEQIAQGR